MSSSPAPIAVFTASTADDGAVLGSGGLLPVTRTVSAITAAGDRNQPKMNAAHFLTPRSEARTRRNAVSGSRSSVIARPMRTRSRITVGSGCGEWRCAVFPALLPDEPDDPSRRVRRQARGSGPVHEDHLRGLSGLLLGSCRPPDGLLRPHLWPRWPGGGGCGRASRGGPSWPGR